MNDAAAEHSAAAEFKGAADPSMPVAVQQAAIMREAIDLRIDGIGLTVTDPVVLGPLIRQAVAAEIPVVALNIPVSDEERVQHDLPILAYVGQIERPMAATAALRARDTLAAKGRTMDVALCVQGSVAEPWAIQRCEGMAAALEPLGVRVDVLAGDFFAQPPNVPTAAIETWFADNPDVDYVFSTATSVLNLMLSLQSSGKIASEVLIGSVDLNEETLDAIETGRCDFAVDQQPYLQGYMTVQLLSLNLDYALRPGGDIPTGPFFVTADNVATIKQLVSQGIR